MIRWFTGQKQTWQVIAGGLAIIASFMVATWPFAFPSGIQPLRADQLFVILVGATLLLIAGVWLTYLGFRRSG